MLDEAGMLGASQAKALFEQARDAGAGARPGDAA